MTAAALLARREVLRATVKEHKRQIAKHRVELQAAATELTELEAHCQRLRLGLYTQQGVGEIHGRPHD